MMVTAPGVQAQDAAINATGAAANTSSILDLDVSSATFATKRGLLIPRMTRAQRLAIAAPANGLWVFQTDDAAGEFHGLWYYDAVLPAWVRLPSGAGWETVGNAGTNPAAVPPHYLGTADANPLVIRTNSVERMRLLNTGTLIGISTIAPTEALEVNGGVRLYAPGANNATTQAGVIRFNTTPPAGTTNTYHEGNTTGTPTGWGRLENAERVYKNAPYAGSVLQCDTGDAQTPNNAGVSTGLANTCFPTAQRNAKIQYIYLASELTSWGLCPGIITRLEITVMDDDPQSPNPGAALQLEATINATALTSLPTFDAATSAAPVNFYAPVPNVPVGSGQYVMDLTALGNSTFNWNGTSNLIVEICWTRSPAAAGINPKIQLNTAFANATRYGYDAGPSIGCTMTEVSPATAVRGNQGTRAAIKWFGQAMMPVPILANSDFVYYDGGLMVEANAGWAATPGNYRGPGTVSAEWNVYDNVTALSDHVFDRYYDGAVKPEDREAAARFDYNYVELDQLKAYMAEHRHLPSMPSREQFEAQGKPSLGELGTRLWQTVETQALYIAELEHDLRILEDMAFEASMTDAELGALIQRVEENPRLTAGQKDHLIATIRQRNDRSNQH